MTEPSTSKPGGDSHIPSRRPGIAPGLARAAAALGLAALFAVACGLFPTAPLTDFTEALFDSLPTQPAPATLEFMDVDPQLVFAPTFNLPDIPEGTIQPLVGPSPDWWYLVPVHRQATAAGSIVRDYHYQAPISAEEMTDYYEEAMRQGGWVTFMDPLHSGSYSMLTYTRSDTRTTIYISPHAGGSLVSIIIE